MAHEVVMICQAFQRGYAEWIDGGEGGGVKILEIFEVGGAEATPLVWGRGWCVSESVRGMSCGQEMAGCCIRRAHWRRRS